ncbi:MAG TPA: hypothetical protein VH877_10090 [Polyangia bacterium]|nr:hypothetical protein [Polyangia bacterium]
MANHRLPDSPRPRRITWAERLAEEGELTKNDPPDPPVKRHYF